MKKPIFAMCCIAAMALMTSCTTDNIEEPESMTVKNNPETLSAQVIDSTTVTNFDEYDHGKLDKDKVKE
jgi:heme-binding NEAT domain protein